MSKRVTCDYCDKEYPKYSYVDGVRYEFAPKLRNGLRRCAHCTAQMYLDKLKDMSAEIEKDSPRRDGIMQ